MTVDIKEIKSELKALRAEMRKHGIKKTSAFNGGLDMYTYSYNARRFALETKLDIASKASQKVAP